MGFILILIGLPLLLPNITDGTFPHAADVYFLDGTSSDLGYPTDFNTVLQVLLSAPSKLRLN